MSVSLLTKYHSNYFRRILQMMPTDCDTLRLTLAFFAISGLDMLNAPLDENILAHKLRKKEAIEWIYRMQIKGIGPRSGFEISPVSQEKITKYNCGHLAMTYTALASLLVLGDNLEEVDKDSIIEGIRACQNPDGSFTASVAGCESDMRFVYCACCISAILDDWSGINKEKAIDYILKSISYDGAIGQGPGLESHGGSTFCATASLYLMNELHNVLSKEQLDKLKRWCLMRQERGFHGRPGKDDDTCYSFWIGATLQILGVNHLHDHEANRKFVLEMQDPVTGGISRQNHLLPDPLHTYLGLCGLSLLGEPNMQALHAALNISQRAYAHMQNIHKGWHK